MAAVLRYPGSKNTLAETINAILPARPVYVEPFAGSLAVLLNRQPAQIEIVNDLDHRVVNLFRVLRDPTAAAELARLVAFTPYSREEYQLCREPSGDPVEDARRFVVRAWQGHGSHMVGRSGWKRSICGPANRNMPRQWSDLPDKILSVVSRLRFCQIEHRDALQLIADFRRSAAAMYLDPPYVPQTLRSHERLYEHVLTLDQHIQLLDLVQSHPGPVVLSGYPSQVYDEALASWTRREFDGRANGRWERVEVLWWNRHCDPLPAGCEEVSL